MFKKSLSEKLMLSLLCQSLFCLSLFCLCLPALSFAQVGGSLVAYPPVEINLDISESADGMPVLSAEEIKLVTGEYYRLNVTSSGMTDWRLELPELLQNSHRSGFAAWSGGCAGS